MAHKTKESQLRASKAYRQRNLEKSKLDSYKRIARLFIKDYADFNHIAEFNAMLNKRGINMTYNYKHFKDKGISHDYEELIKEFSSDIAEGLICDKVLIQRELVSGANSYASIVDYYYSLSEVPDKIMVNLEKVDEVLQEMQAMNEFL